MTPPTVRSPELALLLGLLRTALGSQETVAGGAPIDWDTFLTVADRHRVSAFLHHRAAGTIRDLAPPHVAEQLRGVSQVTARRSLLHVATQRRLVRLLEDAQIDVIPVKGVVLSQTRYGSIGIRHVGDIDLFIREGRVADADRLLQAAGLKRTRPEFPLSPRQLREYLRLKPEFEYVDPASGLRIELLWHLEGVNNAEPSLWAYPTTCRIGDQAFRMLPPSLEAVYLLQHGARHAWFRLFWLVDAALLLRDASLEWDRIAATARAWDAHRAVYQAAALARDLLGVIPPATLPVLRRERRLVLSLETDALREIRRPIENGDALGAWLRQLRYRMRLQQTLRGKYRTLTPHLFSPETWRHVRLPDRWFGLYHVLTPLLWVWRRIQR